MLGQFILSLFIRVIAKLPNTEQSSKGKVKTHKSINRQNRENVSFTRQNKLKS